MSKTMLGVCNILLLSLKHISIAMFDCCQEIGRHNMVELLMSQTGWSVWCNDVAPS